MNYISTTDLPTKSSELVASLLQGTTVSLMHRSKLIAVIKPSRESKRFDSKKFREIIASIKPAKLVPKADREKVYREHLMKKYGDGLS